MPVFSRRSNGNGGSGTFRFVAEIPRRRLGALGLALALAACGGGGEVTANATADAAPAPAQASPVADAPGSVPPTATLAGVPDDAFPGTELPQERFQAVGR